MSEKEQHKKKLNRDAQRAFRDRKERYIKELEEKVTALEKEREQQDKRIKEQEEFFKGTIRKLESEKQTLNTLPFQFSNDLATSSVFQFSPPTAAPQSLIPLQGRGHPSRSSAELSYLSAESLNNSPEITETEGGNSMALLADAIKSNGEDLGIDLFPTLKGILHNVNNRRFERIQRNCACPDNRYHTSKVQL